MPTTSKKGTRVAPKQNKKWMPVWDGISSVVKDAAEAKMLLKRVERKLARYYKKHPPSPRCSPSTDFEFTF